MIIKYLKHSEIDKSKWDECILNSLNSLIYVHSFYLDNCTSCQWDALILDDYQAIMPITFRNKYGISYLYQPAFLQQGGIFFKKSIDQKIINLFLAEILKHFKFAEINLNYANEFVNVPNLQIKALNNFILPLNKSYLEIASNFSNVFIKNVKKAKKYSFDYEKLSIVEPLVDLFKKLYGSRFLSVKQKDYDALSKNCNELIKKNNIVLRTASIKGEIYAGIILLRDEKRIYNISPSVTLKGRKLSANHFLYNSIIKEFSESNLIFDFEGSDIKGIADFYQSMTPLNQKYFSIKYNRLPKLIKLFKK